MCVCRGRGAHFWSLAGARADLEVSKGLGVLFIVVVGSPHPTTPILYSSKFIEQYIEEPSPQVRQCSGVER